MSTFEDARRLQPERLSLKIRAFRKQYGYTQEALARRLGVQRNTLLRWENGQVRISNVMLRLLQSEGVV